MGERAAGAGLPGGLTVLLRVRRATSDDVPILVQLYDRVSPGGYSASFDRYGAIRPEDFWWIQSEKEVWLLEVDHRTAGAVIIGRREGALVVEEVVAELPRQAVDGDPLRTEQTFVQRLGAYLLQHVRRERQERFLLRTAEANALGLALARSLDLVLVNLLLVTTLRPRGRQTPRPPDGYAVRKAAPADATELVRIYRECYPTAPQPAEVENLLRRPEVRTWVAERDRYLVGFLLAEAHKGGFGDLVAGVREPHRRRGLGRALVAPALNFFQTKQLPVLGLFWGSDSAAQGFYRALGFATERVYLFFEKSI